MGNKLNAMFNFYFRCFLPTIVDQFNPFPNKPWFLRLCSRSRLKTLWEKEKLLVTSNFYYSHSVFCPFRKVSAMLIKFEVVVCKLFQFGRVQNLSFGKGIIQLLLSSSRL